jgi:hypothetical protein
MLPGQVPYLNQFKYNHGRDMISNELSNNVTYKIIVKAACSGMNQR